MATSSNGVVQQGSNAAQNGTMPYWLDSFLKMSFFEKCPAHDLPKHDLNRYCITCNASTCKSCAKSGHHKEHELLTVYRHVYKNAVPVSEMGRYIDCANIQHFRCNEKLVVPLTPLPHKGSGSLIDGDGACTTCKRKLPDHSRYRFCSISCKVNQRSRKRNRKGVPCRAPSH